MPKIYLVATNTKKPISRAITAYTGEKFNHASIAFDPSLIECYSYSMAANGFTQEDRSEWPTWTEFAMYELTVTSSQLEKVKAFVRREKHSKRTFSYGGIAGIIIQRPIEDEEALFCSEFVERACLSAGLPATAENPALTTPESVVRRPKARLLSSGNLHQYIMANYDSHDGYNMLVEECVVDLDMF